MSHACSVSATPALSLTGRDLTVEKLGKAIQLDQTIDIAECGWTSIRAARSVVDHILETGEPVYGLTTGLGASIKERISPEDAARFSLETMRGRAHAIGKPMPRGWVRAGLLARLNSFCIGASGVDPDIVHQLLDIVNAGLVPVVGETGSIGASDLCWNASMMLPLTGEGQMMDRDGVVAPALEHFKAYGLSPLVLGPRDGLALSNHSSLSAGLAGLTLMQARHIIRLVEGAGALSLEAFRANLSPLDENIRSIRKMPGEDEAARGLSGLLEGSDLWKSGTARRVQDPLSLRNMLQLNGTVYSALGFAGQIIEAELNGAGDNPAVVLSENHIRSTGNYLTNQLAFALETLMRAYVPVVIGILGRLSVLQASRFTDLPALLMQPGTTSNGLAPVTKIAEALAAEILHLSNPAPLWPSICADGVEDVHANAALVAKNAYGFFSCMRRLIMIELMAGCQAVDLQEGFKLPQALEALYASVREHSPMIRDGRPLGAEIEALAASDEAQPFLSLEVDQA